MAAPYNPPVSGEDFVTYITLEDAANPGHIKINPTIALGDFQFSADDGSLSNPSTTPSVSPTGSAWVKLTFSAGEFTGGNIKVQAIDQTTPKEWRDWAHTFVTT